MKKASIFLTLFALTLIVSEGASAQEKRSKKSTDHDSLTVLAYNIFMRPTLLFKDKQMARAKHIVKRLNNSYDVLVLSEVFDDQVRAYIVQNMTAYPYKSRILGRSYTVGETKRRPQLKNGRINGGVLILSRYPIVKEKHRIYSSSLFPDSLSAKGVLQVSIKKKSRLYHIFGTHLQAGKKSSGGPKVRYNQVKDILALIEEGQFSKRDGVIVAGDLNMNLFSQVKRAGTETEAQRMLRSLSMLAPKVRPFQGRAITRLIDYVLVSSKHRAPSKQSLEKLVYFGPIDGESYPLSDHPAVLGRFRFPRGTPSKKTKRLY